MYFILLSIVLLSSIRVQGLDIACLEDGNCPTTSELYNDNKWWKKRLVVTDDIWNKIDCPAIFFKPRPIHNESTWKLLREAYQNIVGSESTLNLTNPDSGFNVNFNVQQSKTKGRAVYAAEPVKKGELIWTATRQSARFKDGASYKEFLTSIPIDLACDVIQWAYVQSFDKNEVQNMGFGDQIEEEIFLLICVDLDEGSFMNGSREDPPNVGLVNEAGSKFPAGWRQSYLALHNIDVGEEFVVDYGQFAVPYGWKWFGLEKKQPRFQ